MESTHLPIHWVPGALFLGLSARGAKFNTHFQLMPRLRKSKTSLSGHLHSFKASLLYRDIFPFIFADKVSLSEPLNMTGIFLANRAHIGIL
jgi:hypothetical protein